MAEIPNVNPDSRADTAMPAPDRMVTVRETFGIDTDMKVRGFANATAGIESTGRSASSRSSRNWARWA